MKYSVKQLAKAYDEFLKSTEIDVVMPKSQPFNISTYNEYKYKKLIKNFDLLYNHTDSLTLSEKFLKGE